MIFTLRSKDSSTASKGISVFRQFAIFLILAVAASDLEEAIDTGTCTSENGMTCTGSQDDGSFSSRQHVSSHASLWSFVSRNGGDISGSEISEGPPRGLVASAPLPRGTAVVKLPFSLLVTEWVALETDLAEELVATAPKQTDKRLDWRGLVLVAWLLAERSQPESRWKSYLDSLPTWNDFENHPQILDDADARLCVANRDEALRKIKIRNGTMEDEFELLSSLPSWRFSVQDFQWARLVVFTRGFTVPALYLDIEAEMSRRPNDVKVKNREIKKLKLPVAKGPQDVAVLFAPFADMLNHNRRPNAEWRYSTADGFVVETTKDVAKGEELVVSYGDKSNEALLLEYGFAGWLTRHDLVTVNLRREAQSFPLQLSLKPISSKSMRKMMAFLRGNPEEEGTLDLTKDKEVHSLQLLHDACSVAAPASNVVSRLPGCAAYLRDRADLVGICIGFAIRSIAILAGLEDSLPSLGESILDRLVGWYVSEWLVEASALLPWNQAKAMRGQYRGISASAILQEVLGY
mmetsp:Transcript_3864/g.7731  ORF Transcript_3864/g.7731 Transcript_3864/m.7731 type:complete len:520 (-) Transcript_3864:88-1647(-)